MIVLENLNQSLVLRPQCLISGPQVLENLNPKLVLESGDQKRFDCFEEMDSKFGFETGPSMMVMKNSTTLELYEITN